MPKSVFTASYGMLLDLLKATRANAGLTQLELAQRLGRPQPFISYVESGERRVDVIEFCAIMRALDTDPETAFSELLRKLPARIEM